MNFPELLLGGLWGMNLLAICAANFNEIKHCIAVLLLYSATYFLFVPLHAVIFLVVWTAYGLERGDASPTDGVAVRAAVRLLSVETVMFWALYWGMMLELVPLHLRV